VIEFGAYTVVEKYFSIFQQQGICTPSALDAYGHGKAAGFTLTAVRIESSRITLGAKPGNLDIFPEQAGFQQLMSADGPEIEMFFIQLKPREAVGKLLLPVAEFGTAWAQGGSYCSDDISGLAIEVIAHELDRIAQNVLNTTAPAGVNCGSNRLFSIVEKDCLTVRDLYHHEEVRQLSDKPVLTIKRISSGWIDARVLLECDNVTAVTLPGVNKGRTLGGSPNPTQIFSNLTGLVSGIVTYVQARKRG
jgi:hypothetical protein